MLPILLNDHLEKINIIDTFSSFIWCERFYTHGEFELVFGYKAEYADMLDKAFYVARDDDLRNLGVIEQTKIQLKENGGYTVTLSGRFATCLFERRVFMYQTLGEGTLHDVLGVIFESAMYGTYYLQQYREYPFLDFDVADTYTQRVDTQWTGITQYKAINALSMQFNVGNRVAMRRDSNTNQIRLKFQIYTPKDRSINQSDNTRVIFSHKYDNIINAEYIKDKTVKVTTAVIGGEGEGYNRKVEWVNSSEYDPYYGPDEHLYVPRFETYVDARDVQSETDRGTLTPEEYTKQLKDRGYPVLHNTDIKLSGKVNFSMLEYRQDVDIGDIVTIELAPLSKSYDARIIEVIESRDSSGAYSITPTFENVERS